MIAQEACSQAAWNVALLEMPNPIINGFENFCRKCVECGIDGVIIPDLPFRDYQEHYRIIAERYNIKVMILIRLKMSGYAPDLFLPVWFQNGC